ncbi:hypothetical protein FN846DRAFT_887490 [Sphaerosporella brunnea]|uniref:Uncharacterized protein n=1 Tax=Sphaerosporella brunnea TaxID=1250544 RepID=A0A5J5F6Z8_9PEZI|nr:hypothetical protein FN846DRAFT_887490 [Sphaerosporella brunnea]
MQLPTTAPEQGACQLNIPEAQNLRLSAGNSADGGTLRQLNPTAAPFQTVNRKLPEVHPILTTGYLATPPDANQYGYPTQYNHSQQQGQFRPTGQIGPYGYYGSYSSPSCLRDTWRTYRHRRQPPGDLSCISESCADCSHHCGHTNPTDQQQFDQALRTDQTHFTMAGIPQQQFGQFGPLDNQQYGQFGIREQQHLGQSAIPGQQQFAEPHDPMTAQGQTAAISSLGSDTSGEMHSDNTTSTGYQHHGPGPIRTVRGRAYQHAQRPWQKIGPKINPAAQEFVPRPPLIPIPDNVPDKENVSAQVSEQEMDKEKHEELDFAPPLPADYVFPKTDTEPYDKKMERWLSMDDDEFCYIGDGPYAEEERKPEPEKKPKRKRQHDTTHRFVPQDGVPPRTPRMSDAQYQEEIKN